jgi:hypothetical protein
MPSTDPLPTVAQLVQAATGSASGAAPSGALQGARNTYGDGRSGSMYNHPAGTAAVLFSREAQRDQDLFRDLYFDDATGWALTRYVQGRTGITRVLDAFGQGLAVLSRSSASAGSNTIYQGTRIQVAGNTPFVYQVSADTLVGGTSATVPIVATVLGTGQALDATAGLTFLDPTYDPLWEPVSLRCSDGTGFESAADYRARVRATQVNSRKGYIPFLVQACQDAGAAFVVPFASNFGLTDTDFTDDAGLNAIYVADANYQFSPALINACTIALESSRVLGADLWVGGIVQTPVELVALVSLRDNPGKLPIVNIRRSCTQALLGYFASTTSGYTFKRMALGGAMSGSTPFVQTVNWVDLTGGSYSNVGVYIQGQLAPTDPVLASGSFPANLPRYTLAPNDISLIFIPPV